MNSTHLIMPMHSKLTGNLPYSLLLVTCCAYEGGGGKIGRMRETLPL